MGDLVTDVAKALRMLRRAYAEHNLECPTILSYSNRSDAHDAFPAIMTGMDREMSMARLPQGDTYEVELYGFKIRHNVERDTKPNPWYPNRNMEAQYERDIATGSQSRPSSD